MKCAELIQLHLIAIGKVCLNFFYKGFNHMFYIAFGHGAILLNGGGQYVDIHLATCEGDLTEIKLRFKLNLLFQAYHKDTKSERQSQVLRCLFFNYFQ